MITEASTLFGLFDTTVAETGNRIDGIEIPLLQRDYAQGRRSSKVDRVRKSFLDALFCACKPGGRPIKLDFIYGSVEQYEDNRWVLTPLDGQQRLTTLYLLHWYAAKREAISDTNYAFLGKFTYRTRFSSRDFCRELISYHPNFGKDKISTGILDQSWFMPQWEHDPTIASMLVMLDAIHQKFQDLEGLWAKLVDTSDSAISFYFLPIEKIGLTDSLYIKMNSRGKALTDFEHYKAEFEKILHGVDDALREEFIHKIDTNWTDMFWEHRAVGSVEIDSQLMRYLRFLTEVLCFEQNITTEANDIDLAENVFGSRQEKRYENVRFLIDALDCWASAGSIDHIFSEYLTTERHEAGKLIIRQPDTNLFRQCCTSYGIVNNGNRLFTLNNTILLYAFLVYRLNQGTSTIKVEEFAERIRIVRNLVANSQDEIREQHMGRLLRETQIIVKLGKIDTESINFSKAQKEEELKKMAWRREWPTQIAKLNELEDHYILTGAIAIIGLGDGPEFERKASGFIRLFDGSVSYDAIKQAMLCLGDYSQRISWRFVFGGKNPSTWRDLLTVSSQRHHFINTFDVFAVLLDKLTANVPSTLEDILETYLGNLNTAKDWRYYFVKYAEMRKGESGVFHWQNDKDRKKIHPYNVLMMNTPSALNGKHWNPFHYAASCLFSDVFTLETYGNPLLLRKTGHRIFSTDDAWVVKHPAEDIDILKICIQTDQNGVDQTDRIALLGENIQNIVAVCIA